MMGPDPEAGKPGLSTQSEAMLELFGFQESVQIYHCNINQISIAIFETEKKLESVEQDCIRFHQIMVLAS